MSIDRYKGSKRKINSTGTMICVAIVIIAVSFLGYYKYQQSNIKPPEGFSVESETKDLNLVGTKWLETYIHQYERIYAPRNLRVLEYSIENLEIKEPNVVQIDFSIVTKALDERGAYFWNGVLEEDRIKCQWVLWFKEEKISEVNFLYTATKLQRPAGYDLEKYQTSGEKERDEYKNQYESEIPYEEVQYTYKIQNGSCYVSYDKGITWREVPVPLEKLVAVGDGRPYYNKLQEESYIITPEKTSFVYGGTRENPLVVTYSEDKGATWKTAEISKSLDSTRVKFCSFPTVKVGYVIATGGRTMSQEGQIIYKTIDGGASWKEVGAGPSTWLLQSGGFVDESLGFMSYPKIEGAETNFYKTEDGGKTFEPIILPVIKQEWMGSTFEPFIQPQTPYVENGELFLLVGQGGNGDFKGGTVMAKLKSNNRGKSWSLVELVDPPSKERG